MTIAFTTQGTDWDAQMDPRFGRTRYFLVLNEETDELRVVDNSAADEEAHGAGPKTAQKLMEFGATTLITGNGPGGNAAAVLASTGIKIYVGAGDLTVKDALAAYREGRLEEFKGA